jgi:chromate reductase, NAD(P)H dehydrogenase (quinone)
MTPSGSIHVLGISGSLRKTSYKTALLRAAAELVSPEMTLEIVDLAPLPLFNQEAEKPFPGAVVEFRTRLAQANAPLITTSEYNSSVNGALKNAIEQASRSHQQP